MRGSRLFGALLLAVWLTVAVLAVQLGADYYRTPLVDRPFSADHEIFKPAGLVVSTGETVTAVRSRGNAATGFVVTALARESFRRIKPKNHERVEAAVAAGALDILWSTNLVRIEPDSITYRNGGDPATLPNDYTFIFAGGELPTKFLRDCGVEIDTKFGAP